MKNKPFIFIPVLIVLVFALFIHIPASVQAATATFSNTTALTITDANGSMVAQPSTPVYPSSIAVSGVAGTISKVTVTLTGLTHPWTGDIDVLLVGPGGQNIMLASDAHDNDFADNVTWTFDDGGAALPATGSGGNTPSGTYRPTNNNDGWEGDGCVDGFPAPAPAPSGNTTLAAAFNGLSGAAVNGNWQLFIVDDCNQSQGSLSGGWSITIEDNGAAVAPSITSAPPGAGTVGVAYSHTYTATGTTPITYSLTGTLPPGLNLVGDTISGTPTTAGTFTGTVTAANGTAPDATQAFSITIAAASVAPAITSAAPGAGTVGVAYSHTYTATGTTPITYSVTGTLPPGLNLVGDTISGTPTTAGTYTGTVTATNGTAPDATQPFSITIAAASVAPAITSAAPGAGTVGVAYSHTYTATGTTPITYSVTGTLPPGLNLVGDTISGTPTTAGTFTGTVTAANGTAPDDAQPFSITITAVTVAPSITSAAPGAGTVGVAYSHTYTATGTTPITYSLTGTLPPGLNLVGATISGTPTTAGTYTGTVTAANGTTPDDAQPFSITIGTTPPPVIPPTGQSIDELPPPPPAPLCTAVNFDANAGLRATAQFDSMEVNCRMIVQDGQYFSWYSSPLTHAAMVGSQSIVDLGILQAVDVFSPSGQSSFQGDVVICLRGTGSMIFLNASNAPRVPEVITAWTTDAFPGFTCATLYQPGTLVLVSGKPE